MAKKSNHLTKGTQRKIWEMKRKNPDVSVNAIADHFGCTINQVRWAIRSVNEGKGHRPTNRTRAAKAEEIKKEKNLTDLINSQIQYAFAQLEANLQIDPMQRASMLGTLVRANKQAIEAEMQVHLKGMDWATFTEAIRMFQPDATDKDIIKIFNEAKIRCQINSQD